MKNRSFSEKGQALIFIAVAFVILGVFIGLAVDLGRGYLLKARLAKVVDAATLAAAKILKGQTGNQNDAVKAACDSMLMNGMNVVMANGSTCQSSGATSFTLAVNFVPKAVSGGPPLQFVQITGSAAVPTTFIRLGNFITSGNFSTLNVSAFAEGGPERPVDLMLVLDRSGSMNGTDATGTTKITALRTAMTAFLDSNFTVDDRIGMVSFSTRGCGNASGQDSTVNGPCVSDKALGTSIGNLIAAVNGLCGGGTNCLGGTNTAESLLTAGNEINTVFSDPARATSRKAIMLVTDGQPTFLRRFNNTECKSDPFTGVTLPPDGNKGSFPNGCKQGVPSGGFNFMFRQPLSCGGVSCLTRIPKSGSDAVLYRNVIRSTRDTLRGAMFEANKIRNYGLSGGNDVIIFAIAIGEDLGPTTTNPQSSLDENAKCLLARIANDPDTINICNSVYTTTADNDTHSDLLENWPTCATGSPPCIDNTQQAGQVFTVDLNGNVAAQLEAIFNEVAALLKLRLTI